MDKSQILSALLITGIIASVSSSLGAMWDFKNIKIKVAKHDSQLDVIGTVVCEYAIRDDLPNSTKRCIEMLKGKNE